MRSEISQVLSGHTKEVKWNHDKAQGSDEIGSLQKRFVISRFLFIYWQMPRRGTGQIRTHVALHVLCAKNGET